MNFDPNPLFYEMVRLYQLRPKDDKIIIFNEGSSRSSKTWDFFHFLVMFCDHNRNAGLEIYCHRDTLTNCRDYTLKDFVNCLTTIGVFESDKLTGVAQKPYYNLFGNHVYFRGLDDENNMEGYPSDISFFNELLEVDSEKRIAGIKMRCRKLIVADWNPKFTSHWAFEYEGRPNVYFTKTTYKNNKHCPPAVIRELESYEPTEENIKIGTADAYRWKVYGQGERGSMEGLIFPNVNYIEAAPELPKIYGLDFGFTTDPTALVAHQENKSDIYITPLVYEPIEDPSIIVECFISSGITKKDLIISDSSDKYISENKGAIEMVKALRNYGYNVMKVNKTNSVMYWLLSMKQKRINVIKNHLLGSFKKEQENYHMKKINGIAINQPEDKFNHFWDATRYAHMMHNTQGSIW